MTRRRGRAGGAPIAPATEAAAGTGPDRHPARVVMFVRNDAQRDVRVRREAATLAEAGYRVTVMALGHAGLAERETVGDYEIVRVAAPAAWRTRWLEARYRPWRSRRSIGQAISGAARRGPARWPKAVAMAAGAVLATPYVAARAIQYTANSRRSPDTHGGDDTIDWLIRWRYSILGWADRAAAAAPEADVWVGHDLNALAAAGYARDRRGGRLVYDSHELYLEAGATARRPAWARALLARLERRWVDSADAVVTVNDSIAAELDRRYAVRRTLVVRNCPPRWTPPRSRKDPLRAAMHVAPGTPVVLYHGGFMPDRGLDQLADAVAGLDGVHVAFLGFGPGQGGLEARARDPRVDGRLHVIPAVPSEELLDWVACADVSAMVNQPATLNERLSTPNKLFESLAAGTPVVSADTPERRSIVLGDPAGPLGRLCDPTDVGAIRAAIRDLIGLPAAEMAALRARCRKAARDRYNWEIEGARLVDLYRELAPVGSGAA